MNRKLIILILIAFVAFIGCAKKQAEEVVKPDTEMTIIEEEPTEEFEVIEEPVQEDTGLLLEEDITTETTMGEYKVQLFATYDEMKANKVANELRPLFTDEVYVEFIAPYYKVRVGHYKTKEEAERVRDEARMKGYSDAFIVIP